MYKIKYSDNTYFESQDLLNSRWNEINKDIVEWRYYLVNKEFILVGYESYNHLVEKINVFNREIISKVILMGKNGDNVDSLIIDFRNKKFYKEKSQFGREYGNRATSGWKTGIKHPKPLLLISK